MLYFWADPHLGCDKLVANTRKEFGSIEEHDGVLMDLLNSTVGRDDRLVIVGDLCKEKPGRYRPQIRCKNIMFVLGNHDKESKIRAVFGGNVRHQYMAKCGTERVLCGHFPMFSWGRSHYGVWHAYGHWHDNYKLEAMLDTGAPGRRSMDVGVDHAHRVLGEYRPWSEKEFFHHLRDRLGHENIDKKDRWSERDYIKLPDAEVACKAIMARSKQLEKPWK